jgi:hypothetical protein
MVNLSTKELNYLKDFLSWELLMAKKCNQYASQETNSNFKEVFNQAGQLHEQNYLALIDYLAQVQNIQGDVQQ